MKRGPSLKPVSGVPKKLVKRTGKWKKLVREFLESNEECAEVILPEKNLTYRRVFYRWLSIKVAIISIFKDYKKAPVKVVQRGNRIFLVRK